MGDLTREYFWHCITAEYFQKTVQGSKDATYVVKWDNTSHKNMHEVQFDWSCTCKAYKMHPGYCKHIEQVKSLPHDQGGRCGWMQFIDGGNTVDLGKCPRCGGDEIRSMAWMV